MHGLSIFALAVFLFDIYTIIYQHLPRGSVWIQGMVNGHPLSSMTRTLWKIQVIMAFSLCAQGCWILTFFTTQFEAQVVDKQKVFLMCGKYFGYLCRHDWCTNAFHLLIMVHIQCFCLMSQPLFFFTPAFCQIHPDSIEAFTSFTLQGTNVHISYIPFYR